MKHITSTSQFKLSVASSLVLFLSIMYGQKLWSELWLLFAFVELGIIAFYGIVLIAGLKFWIRQKANYKLSYMPFITSIVFLVMIIILPLNWIRNWTDFKVYHRDYETAAGMAMNGKIDTVSNLYELPNDYKSLSNDGGEVLVISEHGAKAVLFYTSRGVPDGMQGFVKVSKGKTIDYFIANITGVVYEIKDLGNQWYYVSGK